ncbi:MAG: hypothetical protein Salg2KO_22870 [Salibacteraceae bacterium]
MNTSVNTRAKFKSIFILKFAQSTEWPADYKQGDFIIAVVNDDDLAKSLEMVTKTKGVNSQQVVIKRYNSAADIEKCHLIYIAGKSTSEVEAFSKKATNYNALIVTEAPGMIDRLSCINFVVSGNVIKYEMNTGLMKNQGLVVSSSLQKLAIKVVQ